MKRRKGFIAIVVLLLVAIGVSGYCYQSARTPEYALNELMEGAREHDAQKVQRYADLSSIVTKGYDSSTEILARDIERLHREYPQDWFFCHDTAFMESYIKERREGDLVFINRSLEFFLTPTIAPIGLRARLRNSRSTTVLSSRASSARATGLRRRSSSQAMIPTTAASCRR